MPDEAPRLVVDDQELLHHSTLRAQRSAELRQAATPPPDLRDWLIKHYGLAALDVGSMQLHDYHVIHRQSGVHDMADGHDKMSSLLRGHVTSSNEADQEGGNAVGAADRIDR